MTSPTHVAASAASSVPPPAPLVVPGAVEVNATISQNKTPRARADSEIMTPAAKQTSKHPQIPIESLQLALSA
jgi:hypothetical protein